MRTGRPAGSARRPRPVIRRVVTTRAGGASAPPYDTFNLGRSVGDDPAAVRANQSRLADQIGLPPERLVWMRMVHGAGVTVVDAPQAEPVPGTDGLVTAQPDLALVVDVADCVPVLLADDHAGVVGAVHAGRPGAAAGVVPAAVAAMVRLGARVDRIDALLGPAICGACYEVPPAMQADVESALPGSACRTRQGTAGLDLRAGISRQLADAGVPTIAVDPACTYEDPRFYSYRAERVTGRFAGLVWITSR